jgi:WD40 repeat protein
MLVYGVSGTGKSSLIHCGLANKFQNTDWLPIVIRRGGNIIESMASGIRSASITEQQSKLVTPADFKKGVRSLYLDHYKPVFFIFDQFEELFIFGDKEERKSFINIVKSLFESELQCRLIFVMREEYMAGVTEFEKVIPTFFANRVRIEKMSQVNALEAIKGPCNVFNINLEEGFAETLLEKLSPGGEDVELTYLQVFLDKIFRLAAGFLPPLGGESKGGPSHDLESQGGSSAETEQKEDLSFSLSLLQKTGNVSDLLGSFLDEQISLLNNPEYGLAVLKSFVSMKGTKRQMRLAEVSDFTNTLGKQIDEKMLNELLHTFIHLRILRDKDQDGKYELRHDALAAKIYEKITLVEKEIIEIRQFIENAYANYEKRKIFLEPDDLNYIAPYEDKLFLNKKLSDFVENSKKNILAKKRAFHRTLSYSAAGFLIIIVSIVIYYFRLNVRAKSEKLTTEAFLQNDFSPSLSFQTALNAYNKDSTSTIAIKALFDAFYAMLDNGPSSDSLGNVIDPQKAIFDFTPCSSKISYAKFSRDGKYIYGFQEDNTLNIWDIKGKLVFSKRENLTPVASVKLSPDNKYIGIVYWDSTAVIWNLNGEKIYKSDIVFNPLNPFNVIDFSPKNNIITVLKGNNIITVHNLENSSDYELKGHTGEVNGAVFSPDGRFIASASKDSTIFIWQYIDSSGSYEKANRLTDIKSVVWSVDFAKNSKYILSVSASIKYPVVIWKLTGDKVFNRIFYNDTIEVRFLARFPRNYHGRYFDATFISDDEAIRISTFADKLLLSEKLDFNPSAGYEGYNYSRIIFSEESYNLISLNKYLKKYGVDRKGNALDPTHQFNYFYSYVDVSAKSIVTNISGTDFSVLYYIDRLPIRKFIGIRPSFSPDGNYLLCVEGKNLRLYPAAEKELIKLAVKDSIFGKMNTDLTKWRHFLKDF